jgi:hypothetical protein
MTRTSDFETLMQKCATDLEYRTSLANALKADNDSEIRRLLQDIHVGHGGDRLKVLKEAYLPMVNISTEFMLAPDIVPAP